MLDINTRQRLAEFAIEAAEAGFKLVVKSYGDAIVAIYDDGESYLLSDDYILSTSLRPTADWGQGGEWDMPDVWAHRHAVTRLAPGLYKLFVMEMGHPETLLFATPLTPDAEPINLGHASRAIVARSEEEGAA